ncbi:MAG: rod shape-determining protein MreC [Candidatus Magasanikbacteria bacterium]|nr:rod shape-determining protein MreC [Candidatus Magasanikbacteria bacterium]
MQPVSMRRLLIALVLFILCVMFLNRFGALTATANAVRQTLSPLLTISFKIAKNTNEAVAALFQTQNALRSENSALRARALDYEMRKAESERLREENTSLLNLLHYTSSTLTTVPAQIVSKGTDSMVQSVVIDRGSESHIKIGDPVIAEKGILIGTIRSVYAREAIAELITDNQSKIGARLLNTDRSIGIAIGSHGLSVQIEMIPQNEIITAGDLIITSGIEKSIPRGLIIGTITTIKKESSEPFQTARLSLPLALNKLSWVAVLTR